MSLNSVPANAVIHYRRIIYVQRIYTDKLTREKESWSL